MFFDSASPPTGWTLSRLKDVARLNPEVLPETTDPSFEIQYVDIGNVSSDGRVLDTEVLAFADAPSRARRLVRSGDTIISTVRTYLRAVTYLAEPPTNLVVSTGFAVLRPLAVVHRPYLGWLVRSDPFVEAVMARSQGVSYPAIAPQELANLSLWLPPVDQQRAIADYLDRETADIDQLVASKAALVDVLERRLRATVDVAVIGGLEESKVKPAFLPGLSIPTRWSEVPIRALARGGMKTFTDGDWIEAPFITTSGIRLIQTGNIGVGEYREQGHRYISEETFAELSCTEVECGDVLVCRLAEPVGRACLAPDLGVRMITSVDVCIVKVSDDFDPRFVVYALSGTAYLGWLAAICRGSTRDRVSRSMLSAVRLPVPEKSRQIDIADFLDQESIRVKRLIRTLEVQLHRLHERRRALISAAVSGPVDWSRG